MTSYALALSDAEVARYAVMAQRAAAQEAEQWAAAGIRAGALVADVGCGPGAVSLVLANLVGPTGTVHGVDRDPQALDIARTRAEAVGVSNVLFSEGPADRTGLAADSVDVVMLRHVLAHNGGREQTIADHLASLVKPGGSVYLADVEASAIRCEPSEQGALMTALHERYTQFQTGRGNDLSVGLRLGELLDRAGLEQVDHQGRYAVVKTSPGARPPAWAARGQMLAAGVVSEAEIVAWEAEFDRLDRGDKALTLFVPTFTAHGRKPA